MLNGISPRPVANEILQSVDRGIAELRDHPGVFFSDASRSLPVQVARAQELGLDVSAQLGRITPEILSDFIRAQINSKMEMLRADPTARLSTIWDVPGALALDIKLADSAGIRYQDLTEQVEGLSQGFRQRHRGMAEFSPYPEDPRPWLCAVARANTAFSAIGNAVKNLKKGLAGSEADVAAALNSAEQLECVAAALTAGETPGLRSALGRLREAAAAEVTPEFATEMFLRDFEARMFQLRKYGLFQEQPANWNIAAAVKEDLAFARAFEIPVESVTKKFEGMPRGGTVEQLIERFEANNPEAAKMPYSKHSEDNVRFLCAKLLSPDNEGEALDLGKASLPRVPATTAY